MQFWQLLVHFLHLNTLLFNNKKRLFRCYCVILVLCLTYFIICNLILIIYRWRFLSSIIFKNICSFFLCIACVHRESRAHSIIFVWKFVCLWRIFRLRDRLWRPTWIWVTFGRINACLRIRLQTRINLLVGNALWG